MVGVTTWFRCVLVVGNTTLFCHSGCKCSHDTFFVKRIGGWWSTIRGGSTTQTYLVGSDEEIAGQDRDPGRDQNGVV
jgi:hypothetical protein